MQNFSNFSPFLRFFFRNVIYRKSVDPSLLNYCYNTIYNRTKGYLTSFIYRLQYHKSYYFRAAGSLLSGTILYQYFENRFVPPVKAASKSYNELIKEADNLYTQQKFEDLYNILVLEKDSQNDEVLWRLARAVYEKARKVDDTEKKKVLYAEALNYLETAKDINNDNFAIHKWLPIIMDSYYSLEGLKSRISHLYEMKHHMERACYLKPNDGTSWYVLGMWYFGIANISWYERKVASLLFATPPQASYQDALDKFLEAERVEPNFYSKNYLMIGKCFYYLGKKDEAKDYFLKAKSYKGDTLDDQEAKKEAEKWL